jgi:hypothetical protein
VHCLLFFLLLTGFVSAVSAETSSGLADAVIEGAAEVVNQSDALRVSLDCGRCDREFLRRNVVYINWVRDQGDAQVHVFVTDERNATGRVYKLSFLGQGEFEGLDESLQFSSPDTDTSDETRRVFQRYFELGLVRYVLRTPMAGNLRVSYQPPANQKNVPVSAQDDPWNSWVFRTSADISLSGEASRDSQRFSGWVNASRTTELWRHSLSVSGSYSERNFEFEDGETLKDVQRSNGFGGQFVRAMGSHWGVGLGAATRESTFLNLSSAYRGAAAIEYNLFPYSEASERELTFTYFLGAGQYDYLETTFLGEQSEFRGDHGFIVSFDTDRTWGDSGIDLEMSHFLDDFDQHRITLSGDIDYRILRGLSVGLRLDASWVSDQIYLPAESATDEEVLIGQRALETDFRFQVGFGLSYTFGSIFNNVVNSRFRGASGGFHRIF